jgi:hypothetical protein
LKDTRRGAISRGRGDVRRNATLIRTTTVADMFIQRQIVPPAELRQQSAVEIQPAVSQTPWSLHFARSWVVLSVALVICLFLLLRLKFRYLFVFDSVNFALALEHFNVTLHQPHPPGYPGFVLITKLIHRVLPDATDVFFATGIIAVAVAAYVLAKLGESLGSAKAGVAAAVLLMFNSSSTSSVIVSPVRNFLAVVSALVAYLAWLALTRTGSRKFFFLAVIALALGSSFRPELTATLLPLLVFVATKQRIPVRLIIAAVALYCFLIFLWIYPTAKPAGGVLAYFHFMKNFFAGQAREAADRDRRDGGIAWLYMAWKATFWTFSSVLTWIWALAFAWKNQEWRRNRTLIAFLLCWIVPGFLFSCFFHIAASGHALATVAAVCFVGGLVLASIRSDVLFIAALAVSAYLNVWILKHPVIAYDEASTTAMKAKNNNGSEILYELFGLRRYKHFFIVGDNTGLYWRTIRYYLRDTPLLMLDSGIAGGNAALFEGQNLTPVHNTVKIPACGKIAWLLYGDKHIQDLTAATADRDWNGLVYLTNGVPNMTLKVGRVTMQSDTSYCKQE